MAKRTDEPRSVPRPLTHGRHSHPLASHSMTPALAARSSCSSSARFRSLALVLALAAYAGDDRLALDFHHEVYRQAEAVVDGRDAYESPDADLSDRSNALWPMAAVLPVVPLTALPPAVADWLATARRARVARRRRCWSSSVRDWRIYGVVLLWPAVIEAIQTANASLPLTLLVAVMWRYRDRAGIAGVALGYARRRQAVPLARRRLAGARRPALGGAPSRRAAASLLLLLPFTSLADYVRLLRNLGATFEHDAYTPFALLTDLGVPDTAARVVDASRSAWPCSRSRGAVAAWGSRSRPRSSCRRSCGVTSYSCSMVPLALSRPRFDAVWLIPIGLWVGDGTFNGAPWQTACVLGLVTRRSCCANGAASPTAPRSRSRRARLAAESRTDESTRVRRPFAIAAPRRRFRSSSRSRCSRPRHVDGSLAADFHNELYPEAEAAARLGEPVPAARICGSRVRARTSSGRRSRRSRRAADAAPARRGRLGDRAPRARRFVALALDRRRPRLAGLRRLRALAAR